MMKTISKYSKLTTLLMFSFLSITLYSQSKDSIITSNYVFKTVSLNFNGNLSFMTDTINYLKYDYQGTHFDKSQYVNDLQKIDFSKFGLTFSFYNKTLKMNDNYFTQNNDIRYLNSNGFGDNHFLRPKDSFNPHGVGTIEESIKCAFTEDNMLIALPFMIYEILK